MRGATLIPDKVAEHDPVHARNSPTRRQRMIAAGYRRLDIYRFGVTLVMILQHDYASPINQADIEIDRR